MIHEICSCGASIQYPAHLGIDPAERWRDEHAHAPKREQEPAGRQGAGFASSQATYLGQHGTKELMRSNE